MNIRVSEKGIDRVRANLKRIDSRINSGAGATVRDSVQAGRDFAKAIAPKDTGALIRAIHFGTEGSGPSRIGWVESSQPDHPVKGKSVPYNVYMHLNPTQHNYGGDPQFMYTTYDFLKKLFPQQMKRAVSAAIEGTGFGTTEVGE